MKGAAKWRFAVREVAPGTVNKHSYAAKCRKQHVKLGAPPLDVKNQERPKLENIPTWPEGIYIYIYKFSCCGYVFVPTLLTPNGTRSDFNSELKSIRRPRGAKNRPAAVGSGPPVSVQVPFGSAKKHAEHAPSGPLS
ncbi:hypothetical protein Bbelb_328320 [Branchiostoma belcheri]|nr:hypothetical protein Bbelb_328320 [Branchiostoma belcheri]